MMYVYAIRDARTGFLQPTFEVNDAVATRNFHHACMNSDSILFSHASDFALYRLASYDPDSGRLEPETVPVFICDAKEALR